MTTDKHESSVLDAMLHVVESQLKSNDPPEVRKTLARLISQGQSEADAKKLIRCVVAIEIQHIMTDKAPFNTARYVEALNRLPTLPWEE